MQKFLNERVGIDFYNLLSTHDTFKSNWKAISPSFYALQRVAAYNNDNHGKASEMVHGIFENIFGRYGDYTIFLTALEDLKLLDINHAYQFNVAENTGTCKKYLATELALELLSNSNTEYLKKLHSDKVLIKKTKKSIYKRKVLKKQYDDPIMNHHHQAMINVEVPEAEGERILEESETIAKRNSAANTMIAIKSKNYFEPHYCDKNGRFINQYTNIQNTIKNIMIINHEGKQLTRRIICDIRSCHPTFFSTFVLTRFLLNTTNVDYEAKNNWHIKGKVTFDKLQAEHKKWLDLFLNKSIDPKIVIANALEISRDEAKQAMIQTMNGNMYFPSYINYLLQNFPMLMKVWGAQDDMNQTGNYISKEYESVMMLDQELYRYATMLGVTMLYENDGFSVYCADDVSYDDLYVKVEYLVQMISAKALKKWGFNPFIKIEGKGKKD